jgi:hypothetical protein
MANLIPAPDQSLEYVAINEDRVVATVIISTSETQFPAMMAAKRLAPEINAGAVMYLKVGKHRGEENLQ